MSFYDWGPLFLKLHVSCQQSIVSSWGQCLWQNHILCWLCQDTSEIRRSWVCFRIRIFHSHQASSGQHRWSNVHTCWRHSCMWILCTRFADSLPDSSSPEGFHWWCRTSWSIWCRTFGSCTAMVFRCTSKWCMTFDCHWRWCSESSLWCDLDPCLLKCRSLDLYSHRASRSRDSFRTWACRLIWSLCLDLEHRWRVAQTWGTEDRWDPPWCGMWEAGSGDTLSLLPHSIPSCCSI